MSKISRRMEKSSHSITRQENERKKIIEKNKEEDAANLTIY